MKKKEDLGITIGTKEEALVEQNLAQIEEASRGMKLALEINEVVIDFLQKKKKDLNKQETKE